MDFLERNRGIILIVAIVTIIGLFGYSLNSNNKSITKEQNIETFKVIDYKTAVKKLKNKKTEQAFYIGCRYCSHCQKLEVEIQKLLNKYPKKNKKQDLIQEIETGFACTPKKGEKKYANYEKIYQYLVDNKVVEANEQKGFGTPQFILVKNGKVVDTLDKYMMKEGERNVKALEEMFKANNYRGFKK